MRVLCIDDTNKPKSVPLSGWIKEGEVYTVTEVLKTDVTGPAFHLAEVSFTPYEVPGAGMVGGYRANRFSPLSGDVSEEEEVELEIHMDEIYK